VGRLFLTKKVDIEQVVVGRKNAIETMISGLLRCYIRMEIVVRETILDTKTGQTNRRL